MEAIPIRQTRAYIDLDAIAFNLRLLSSRVPRAGLVAAVKADGYGHGAVPVARVCEEAGVAMVATANLEEAVILHDAKITLPILILEDLFPDEIDTAVACGFHLTVGSLEFAGELSDRAARAGAAVAVHLNLDTGMGRMGLKSDTPVDDIRTVAAMPGLELEGIFSHFPVADEPDKSFSLGQIEEYTAVILALADAGISPKYRHIANSPAILDFPHRIPGNLIRAGVSIYGMFPGEAVDHTVALRPAMKLVSRIIKITRYERSGTVGYGRTYTVEKGAVIAVVPIGYGDGFPRVLSNRGFAVVHGVRVPIVGRVSMDMITIDLTSVPEEPRLYDEVVLMGSQSWRASDGTDRTDEIGVEEIARLSATITYEITCALTARVPRVYLRNGSVVATTTMRGGRTQLPNPQTER